MIGYIKGNLLNGENGTVLLETNGVGYEIICSASVYVKLLENGGGEVYTYTSVRDDGIFLYGFSDLKEKNLFLKLISVSGVGPKMGITVLSNMNLAKITAAIATSDVKTLSSIKGLGKKTAERIVLELREKMDEERLAEEASETTIIADSVNDDALTALMGLGFTKAECVKALKEAVLSGCVSVEESIAYALRHIR